MKRIYFYMAAFVTLVIALRFAVSLFTGIPNPLWIVLSGAALICSVVVTIHLRLKK